MIALKIFWLLILIAVLIGSYNSLSVNIRLKAGLGRILWGLLIILLTLAGIVTLIAWIF